MDGARGAVPYAVVGTGVALVVAGIGALGGTNIDQPLIMGAAGLAWGLILAALVGLARRTETRLARWARASAFAGAMVSGILIGWAILDLLLQTAILADSPQEFGIFLREPFESVLLYGLILLNTLIEWVFIPAAILLNWQVPRRRYLAMAIAVVYYAMRIWTYLYFVPEIFSWGDLPEGQPFPIDLIEQFTVWVNLSWIRALGDGFMFVGFLVLLAMPAQPHARSRADRTPVAAGVS
jgi:hypothetical protein